ncbi:Putative zinc-or iron-chelating domain-containing protein [Pelagirhabdus alkalitolerans]|uniref:Zinc-or iron-chelating domain-containing protein n=1 Tax=Pelagirhabdus alkalitolerans TaxID=1612202 RepID=A0A1G6KJ23_9BACI|nr:YkgJ family cysteine cluster protein [Pelagirhabdus alkalitolerans]SDC31112.1 Putative zinc-or iron-chelating domain-containing protein [Pelagirhabdus alkalitolerans]
MAFPTLNEVEEKCHQLSQHYEIDDERFFSIIEHWDESDGSADEKLMKSFQALLNQVSVEMDKMDQFMNMTPTCQMGCAFCCYFPIIVTELEAKLIIQAIHDMPPARKNKIINNLKQYEHDQKEKLMVARSIDFKEHDAFKAKYRQLDLPCPLLDLETNACLAYEVRPIPCRTYVNYLDPKICENERMPNETVSFDFLYHPYFEAFNTFLQWLYEDGEETTVDYPTDLFKEDYLINWISADIFS